MERWRGVICKTICVLAWTILPGAGTADEEEQPVAAVQALLRQERLYLGPVNGVLDEPTAAGVRRYQILHGLRATGRLDAGTLRLMLLPRSLASDLSDSDRQLLHDLAQTPIPDPVAEHRKPIPPADPPAIVAPAQEKSASETKRKRAKSAKHRRLSSD